ncbi:Holliday junction resolvase RuvX [Candidatus Beckwithbacteria bacterium]|nr:Holliday junction resolvase RuvX [Candidatus Beckwithbacteria bacterium]
MKYLGIDYGLSHIGLAISDGYLAEPHSQLPNLSDEQSAEYLAKLCQEEGVGKVIVGISESKMAERTNDFIATLKAHVKIPVLLTDETLSSQEALQKLIQAGAKRKKRQSKTHQTAAAIILQNWLESE